MSCVISGEQTSYNICQVINVKYIISLQMRHQFYSCKYFSSTSTSFTLLLLAARTSKDNRHNCIQLVIFDTSTAPSLYVNSIVGHCVALRNIQIIIMKIFTHIPYKLDQSTGCPNNFR